MKAVEVEIGQKQAEDPEIQKVLGTQNEFNGFHEEK